MVIQPKVRGFICTTAHPEGLKAEIKQQIDYVRSRGKINAGKNVLIIGASMGYGLSARIAAAFGGGAATLGVIFDRPAQNGRTASAGWYNTAAFEQFARDQGLYAKTVNADAFLPQTKEQVADIIRRDLKTVDCVIYSVAAPRRTTADGTVYTSVLKTAEQPYTNKTIDLRNGEVSEVTIQPATKQEKEATVKVMGGEDWEEWMQYLKAQGLLADNAVTAAFSYVGPPLTHPIYKDGSIGMAKAHLHETARRLCDSGVCRAFVSVNKALVTQSSSAIPIVPLYISLLYKAMKKKNCHEGCIEQMQRLFGDKQLCGRTVTDGTHLIRLDDYEMRSGVQIDVCKAWEKAGECPLDEIADIEGYNRDFLKLFGFGVDGVDYDADVEADVPILSLQ